MSDLSQAEQLNIYTDGGSRGNPGPAACAFVSFITTSPAAFFQQGKALGIATNNQAEYSAVILALDWLTAQTANRVAPLQVNFFSDSQLLVRQINHEYRVKDTNIYPLYSQVLKSIQEITSSSDTKIAFTHIPRTENSHADLLVNQTLDNL